MAEPHPHVLEHRVGVLEEAVREISESVKSIDKSLALLAASKELHEQTRGNLMDIENRVRAIELRLPVLEVMRNWVIAGVTGGLGLMLAAVGRLILVQ